jgi:hypothetical protein
MSSTSGRSPGISATQPPVTRETLPHPSIHFVIEAGRSGLAGVSSGRFTRVLEGRGRVFGIKFRPGCFQIDGAELTAAVDQFAFA